MELSEKNVEKLRSLQLDNKAFAMKELEGSGSQPAGILFRDIWQCLRWFLIAILECVCVGGGGGGVVVGGRVLLLASNGQMVEMLLNTLRYTGQNPSPQQIISPVQNVSSAAVEKPGIRGLKKSPGLIPSSYF